jgi:transcriptional regulator with XRE-family HTH domain
MPKPATPIRLAIRASGRTQREIAESIGMHEATLSRIANGLYADPDTREQIAEALGVEVSALWPEDVAA